MNFDWGNKNFSDDSIIRSHSSTPASGDFVIGRSSTRSRGVSKKKAKAVKRTVIAANVILSIILCLSLIATTGFALVYNTFKNTGYFDIHHENLGVTPNLNKEIINIALFGVDSRSKVTENSPGKSISGLSDAVIVVSINQKDGTIKMTSFLRDSYVEIEGHGKQKLAHAYSYGGAALTIKTINQNYNLNVTDYVSVSLYRLWSVIDVLGGIDIKITERERLELNRLSNSEGFGVNKVTPSMVGKDGSVHLDGGQAMIYARIRKIDGDDVRAQRQQKVLSCLFDKVKHLSYKEQYTTLTKIMNHVETSLTIDKIVSLVADMDLSKISLSNLTVPDVSASGVTGGTYGSAGWVWRYDLIEASDNIHDWIYGKKE